MYTSLFGQYDALLDQPVARDSDAVFICFTDDPNLTSETWDVRVVPPAFDQDPIRSARLHKILGQSVPDSFDITLYIDASVRLRVTPEELVGEWLADDVDMALATHSYRETVVDEFDEVVRLNYDDRARVYEQLTDYAQADPGVLTSKPLWTGILVRRRSHAVAAAMRTWADHVLRYSRRDQLSIMVALGAGIRYRTIELDNFQSRYHEWPVIAGRRVSQGKSRDLPSGPLLADLRRAKAHVSALERQIEELHPEQVDKLRIEISGLEAQIEQGTQERARIERRLADTTRHAVLLEERLRRFEEHVPLLRRWAKRLRLR
ncbi:DUF616 domain-containing protein [Microbacterium sp. W1N]|uniref:glycosyltransferase domain-containing protein n=1 Tax=Microbacterium festucae TaxID=2977531 RepID=UPI0021C00B5B|nr:glycosyltransferase domain-containing protein [Microbacterium festucae]MCT9818753.1 DUF616 domain-containing protein [Microbacterium festucae]